ncbi:hypothetical protein ACRAWF_24895 [Streptomyces sp. L7]
MVDADQTFVIVGGGLAGAKAAEAHPSGGLHRPRDTDLRRTRPPVRAPAAVEEATSSVKEERDSVFVHEPAWQGTRATTSSCISARTVDAVDRTAKTVRFGDDGTLVHYRQVAHRHRRRAAPHSTSRARTSRAVTTCAASRTPRAPHKGVLATLGRDGNGHLVIAGGGWIGLECRGGGPASTAPKVTVVEPSQTPIARSPRP